eukprot:TRINITY_DN2520_c0_g1_i1.p1 TRINITY_DN2520_c0_g1~~TRINITY_DN2520_c0_g1_i1.p1  ORF type:complete len:317 (-),score=67.13 TRINITY_DN2520_c0_g1_i1:41-991(-)
MFDIESYPVSLFLYVCLIVGFYKVVYFLKGLAGTFVGHHLNRSQIQKFKTHPEDNWAVITGASDGIGAAFAKGLSEKGFKIVLISRTLSKLEEVASTLDTEYLIITQDFLNATPEDYHHISTILKPLNVCVLVNNVGASHSMPENFLDMEDGVAERIVTLNISTTNAMTRTVLPTMVNNKNGLILNISSVAGELPHPMYAVYSASKAYVNYLSIALHQEFKSQGVFVENLTPYLIKTKLSGIQRSNAGRPEPETYVRSVLNQAGNNKDHCGYPQHERVKFIMNNIPGILMDKYLDMSCKTLIGKRKKTLVRLSKEK